MSKTLSTFRTAFVGFVVVLQLILLPATHVLHLGCQHSHDHGPITAASNGEAGSSVIASSHHCDHCSRHAATTDSSPADSAPVQQPHDEDSCALCQVAFATRIATATAFDLTAAEPVGEFVVADSHVVDSTPRYCVLSRGPPSTPAG